MNGELFVGGVTNLGMPGVGDNARLYGGGYTDGFVLALTQLTGQPVQALSAPASHNAGDATNLSAPSKPGRPGSGTHQDLP